MHLRPMKFHPLSTLYPSGSPPVPPVTRTTAHSPVKGTVNPAITRSRSAFQALIAFHRLSAPLTDSLRSPCLSASLKFQLRTCLTPPGVSQLKFCNQLKPRQVHLTAIRHMAYS